MYKKGVYFLLCLISEVNAYTITIINQRTHDITYRVRYFKEYSAHICRPDDTGTLKAGASTTIDVQDCCPEACGYKEIMASGDYQTQTFKHVCGNWTITIGANGAITRTPTTTS